VAISKQLKEQLAHLEEAQCYEASFFFFFFFFITLEPRVE